VIRMSFPEALIWLIQNPESVLTRGNRQPLTLSPTGYLMQLGPKKPEYARVNVQDIAAANWQGMAIDAFIQQAEQAKQEG